MFCSVAVRVVVMGFAGATFVLGAAAGLSTASSLSTPSAASALVVAAPAAAKSMSPNSNGWQ